jgi:hypothetical protein
MRCSPLVVTVAFLSLYSCDVATSRYATLADARNDRLFERGWLPDILPPSTRDIRVSNDLDVNHSEGEFSFDPADFAGFASRLRPMGGEKFQYSANKHAWTFSCDASRGRCKYSLR